MIREQMIRVTLERVKLPSSTPGSMYMPDRSLLCKTLELAWRNNASTPDPKTASCIPNGLYIVDKEQPTISRPYIHFRLHRVPGRRVNADGRSRILIHPAGSVYDLLGCIAPGSRHVDFNHDNIPDLEGSKKKLEYMAGVLPDMFELEIKDKP